MAEEDAQQQAVFGRGALPPQDDRQRELILTEVDGTFLRAQREASPKFEVRLGVLTTGKSLLSPTAKNRRYRLQERVCYAGVETAQDFGERPFLKAEAHLGLSRARHLLLVGGAPAIVAGQLIDLTSPASIWIFSAVFMVAAIVCMLLVKPKAVLAPASSRPAPTS